LFQGECILGTKVGIKKIKAARQTIAVINILSFKDVNMNCPFLKLFLVSGRARFLND
jgi:hypothetical protein